MKESTRVRESLGGGYAGIHSVEVAAEILLQLANFRHPTSLKTLSELCHLAPSKVHRYLSSMTKLGLVFHAKKSGNYSLGRNAITIGLAAMQQNDQLDEVMEALPELLGKVSCHLFLSVWSKAGPTIIKWARAENSLVIGLPPGQILPMTHSAAGLVFAAFLEAAVTSELIAKEELAYGNQIGRSRQDLDDVLQSVRDKGFAVSRGEVESDVTALAVPVVDWEDNPIVVVGAIVSKNTDEAEISAILTEMKKFAEQISVQKPSFPFES